MILCETMVNCFAIAKGILLFLILCPPNTFSFPKQWRCCHSNRDQRFSWVVKGTLFSSRDSNTFQLSTSQDEFMRRNEEENNLNELPSKTRKDCSLDPSFTENELREYDEIKQQNGEMADSKIDLTRESEKLDSLTYYIVVSSLTATASFSTVQQLKVNPSTTPDMELISVAAIIVSSLGVLLAIYTTVAFSLCVSVRCPPTCSGVCSYILYINSHIIVPLTHHDFTAVW